MGCLYQLIVEIFLEFILDLLTDKDKRKELLDAVKADFRERRSKKDCRNDGLPKDDSSCIIKREHDGGTPWKDRL